MNQILPTPMTVDEFLRWSARQERGRYELEGGRVIAMPAETFSHVTHKRMAFAALDSAIGRAGAPCFAIPDGMAVRISDTRAYEPDVIVGTLPIPPSDALIVTNPVIVVEVLSPTPSSMRRDLTEKVQGYGLVPSIEHYLVVDPIERAVLHYRRRGDVLVAPEAAATEGTLRLEPPGLEIPVADMLGPEPATEGQPS